MSTENDYNDLLIENRHLLPDPWYNYPVLQNDSEWESIELLKKRNPYKGSVIKVGVQDGVWTLGYDFLSGGCNPGRKWGEFKSRQDAITYFVKKNLPKVEALKTKKDRSYSLSNAQINEMIENMKLLLCFQYDLF